MASLRDEVLYWQNQAVDAHHDLLKTIQTSAGKWPAAVWRLLAYSRRSSWARTAAATLPVHGSVEIGTVVAYGVAGLVGISALVLANFAAQGIPEILSGTPVTGPLMYKLVTTRAMMARRAAGLGGGTRRRGRNADSGYFRVPAGSRNTRARTPY